MSKIEKKEKDVVRRTAIGWTLYFHMTIPFLLLELLAIVLVIIEQGEYVSNWSEMLRNIGDTLMTVQGSLFGLVGLFFVLLGIVFKFIFYFPAKKHFAKYKDTVKVSLF